jgi:Protein of unknown function (DUF3352)
MAEFTPAPVNQDTPQQAGPTAAAGRPARRAGLLRWGVALVVVALVVGAASVGAVLLASGGTTSSIEGWIPSGTVVYLEGRADLPGDQRQNVGTILATFPGFKDQATLDAKIDQALDQVLQKSGISWTTDLKPWVAGEVGVAVTRDLLDLAAAAGKNPSAATAPDRGVVVLASVKDVALATAWVAKEAGGAPITTTYGDGSITTVDRNGMTLAWATRGTVLLLGPEVSVKAALDTKGASPVAASSGFTAARATAPSAYLGFGFIDTKSILDAMLATAGSTGSLPQACLDSALAALPDWAAGFAHAADGALVMDQVAPVPSGAPVSSFAPKDTSSAIAARLPAGTLVALEGRQAGPALVALWAGLKAGIACDPAQKGSLDQVDTALAAIGGVDSLVGWAGDSALAVTFDGTTWGGGLAAVATDPAGAARTLGQAKAALALAGGAAGITYTEQAYAGATIGIVTIPQMGGAAIPALAVTAQGDLFALGTLDFVKGILDTPAGGGLAAQAGYAHAIDLAGGAGTMDAYVNITGLRAGLETLIPATEKASYDTNVQPFLEPFDAVAVIAKAPTTTWTSRIVLVFK